MAEKIGTWFAATFEWLPKEWVVFFVSMLPLVELRGGLILAPLFGIPIWKAIGICLVGNIIPIPFILLFIKRIFRFMKDHNILKGLVEKLEARASRKSAGAEKGEFLFLLLFVGIPLPGTGAWMGSLIASLFDFKMKRAVVAIFLGLLMAAILVDMIFYGLVGMLVN